MEGAFYSIKRGQTKKVFVTQISGNKIMNVLSLKKSMASISSIINH